MSNTAYIKTEAHAFSETNKITSQIETINGETYFKIVNSNKMRPFFMSIVSDSNHWMFISSNGGLTAGRKNAEYALFPYYTDDKCIKTCMAIKLFLKKSILI